MSSSSTVTAHNGVVLEKPAGMSNGNGHGPAGHGSHPSRGVTPGGTPYDPSQPGFPVFHRKFANPAPLGLMGFAGTTFVLSFYNTGARGIDTPNVIVGLALGYGGLAQLLAGMWEVSAVTRLECAHRTVQSSRAHDIRPPPHQFAAGNTFGATAFTSYGAFWFSFAAIYWPNSGILDAYSGAAESQLADALGFYLLSWFIVTFIFLIASLRSSVSLVSVFFFLMITFILLAAGEFTGISNVTVAGGAFGIITAFCAFYTALAGLLTPDTSFFVLPIGPLSPK